MTHRTDLDLRRQLFVLVFPVIVVMYCLDLIILLRLAKFRQLSLRVIDETWPMRPEAGPNSPCLAYRYRTVPATGNTRVHMRVLQHRMFARCVFVLAAGSIRGGLGGSHALTALSWAPDLPSSHPARAVVLV